MSRTTRRQALRSVAPVVGLLAAGLLVWQGSTAAFSATAPNTSDAWTTGSLALTNNGGTATFAGSTTALFSQTGMKIGDTGTKCITVESAGTLAGSLRLYRGAVSGTNSVALAPQIALTIDAAPVAAATNVAANCTNFPSTGTITSIASGTALSALPSTFAAAPGMTVATGTQRVAYRIQWTLNSTGTNTGDNGLQTSTAQADLNFEIQ